jgi:hypothetical protein
MIHAKSTFIGFTRGFTRGWPVFLECVTSYLAAGRPAG